MARNKSRLCLAIYSQPHHTRSERHSPKYCYALHLCSKTLPSRTTKYHARTVMKYMDGSLSIPWVFEAVPIDSYVDTRMIARIQLGKVTVPQQKMEAVLRNVSTADGCSGRPFNNEEWIRRALEQCVHSHMLDDVSTSWVKQAGWEGLNTVARQFVERKRSEGAIDDLEGYGNGSGSPKSQKLSVRSRTPSLDLLTGEEFIPS